MAEKTAINVRSYEWLDSLDALEAWARSVIVLSREMVGQS
jgi:hypothetical protein